MESFTGLVQNAEFIRTDVLVIGAGAAGLRAAIEIAKSDLSALVISKGPVGIGTCTTMSGGVFAAAIHGPGPEEHRKDTLQSGRGLNRGDLVTALVSDVPAGIDELVAWGLRGRQAKGCFYAEGAPPVCGRGIIDVLLEKAKSTGTRFMGDTMAVQILSREERIAGLVAYDFKRDRIAVISCGAVVLAMGGASAIYSYHDNPQRIMGDGYALAFRARAKLMDMEFVQFYPIGLCQGGKAPFLLPPALGDWGGLVNDRGEDIHAKYGLHQRPAALHMRDHLSRAIWTELYENHAGGIFCDISALPNSKWSENPLAHSCKDLLARRYDSDRKPLCVHPLAHHTIGGVMINASGETSIAGLFAAGEITGGVHGANRMGGNALSETVVFGRRAGRSAAEFAAERDRLEPSGAEVRGAVEVAFDMRSNAPGISPKVLRRRLQKLMWNKVGIVRSEQRLTEALEELQEMGRELSAAVFASSPRERMETIELHNALLVGRTICEAALMRRESRGAHFRKDHPEQDDHSWKAHIVLENAGREELKLSLLPQEEEGLCSF